MPSDSITTGQTAIDAAVSEYARAEPDTFDFALSLIRWIATAQDGSDPTTCQSLDAIVDLAAAVRRP